MDNSNRLKVLLGGLYQYFEPFLLEFKRISCCYPASKEYHHSHENGLFQHSLEVAIKCGEILEANRDEYIQRYTDETTGAFKQRYDKLLFHTVLAGLLHDAGKIGAYRAKTKYLYVPFFDSLENHQQYEFTGTPGVNYINSNHLAGVVFGILLNKNKKYTESTLFDFYYITQMLEAIHFQHYPLTQKEKNIIYQILKQADFHSNSPETAEIELSLIKEKEKEKQQQKEETKKEKFLKAFKEYSLKSKSNYFVTEKQIFILHQLYDYLLKQINATEEEINLEKHDTIKLLLYKTNKEYIFSNVYVLDREEKDGFVENAKVVQEEVVEI